MLCSRTSFEGHLFFNDLWLIYDYDLRTTRKSCVKARGIPPTPHNCPGSVQWREGVPQSWWGEGGTPSPMGMVNDRTGVSSLPLPPPGHRTGPVTGQDSDRTHTQGSTWVQRPGKEPGPIDHGTPSVKTVPSPSFGLGSKKIMNGKGSYHQIAWLWKGGTPNRLFLLLFPLLFLLRTGTSQNPYVVFFFF